MSIVRGKVLLCKARAQCEPEEGDESYAKALESAGFTCDRLSVLRFEFVNLDELQGLLVTPNLFSGLILTSPRSAEAVGLALGEKESESISVFNDIWKRLSIYCVGAATDRAAKTILNLQNCRGSESGNAKELAEFIVNEMKSAGDFLDTRPLLYPCSIIARDTVTSTLKAAGIALHKLSVYQTLPTEMLETDMKDIFDSSPPEYLVFFSPSAVKYVKKALIENKHEKLMEEIKFVAIGPVTEQALIDSGLKVYARAKQPEPVALSNALRAKLAESS